MRKQGFITLYFDPKAFKQEEGTKLTNKTLIGFGRDMNEQACHLLGYEGWVTGWTNLPEESDHVADDVAAMKDRIARPYVVGETVNPGVLERFATHTEAAQFITDNFPSRKVLAGEYYIDGPEREG